MTLNKLTQDQNQNTQNLKLLSQQDQKKDKYKEKIMLLNKNTKMNNEQLLSLLNDTFMEMENLDEANLQLEAEKDAYTGLYNDAVDEIKFLNTKLDEYEPRNLSENMINFAQKRSDSEKYNQLRQQRLKEMTARKQELIRSKNNYISRRNNLVN